MDQLRVRKIETSSSNYVLYVLFEDGKLKEPICMMYEDEAIELINELNIAVLLPRKG